MMTRAASTLSRPPVRLLLQSVLHRGDQLLWCEVVTRGARHYELYIVPQWDMSMAVIEKFDRAAEAVRRHTELCWMFRQNGWERAITDDQTAHAA